MPEKTPLFATVADLLTYAWVFGLSLLGGAASFVRRVRNGETTYSNILELIGELVISAFAGLVTFFLCQSAHFDGALSAAFIAISGHMGTRIVFMLERMLLKKFGLEQVDSKEDSKND